NCNRPTIVKLPNSVFQPYASVATNLLCLTKGEQTEEIWYWENKLREGVKCYAKTKPIHKSEFDGLKKWWNKRKESDQAWKVPIKTFEENGFNLDIKNPHIAEKEHTYSSKELLSMLHDSFRKSDDLLSKLKLELDNE
ncbi:MAG: N-6 DNA methylase, partial [Candidatus Brocadiales bacterium]|nr:N-6 DNA methylase [Candidatus Brocadiales bacterium]